jgi:phospholipid/cholesterol/gamma-HCH transport system substrate-binding protein
VKRDTINYFVVGVFVLTLSVAFLLVIYKMTGSSGNTDEYSVYYENVTGIKYGTPVFFEGYQIGQVEEITPEFQNGDVSYRLRLSVIENWEIQSDAVAEIVSSGLLSAVSIDIKQGNSRRVLSPGDTIIGLGAANLFETVNEVARDLQDITNNNIKPFIENLNQHVDLISADVQKLTKDQLIPILENKIGPFIDKLNSSADRLGEILSEKNIDNFDNMLINLNAASAEANTLLENLELSRKNIDSLIDDTNNVVAENRDAVRSSINDLESSLDTISLHVDAIAHDLETSSRNIQEFTRSIRENPSVLLLGTDDSDNEDQ